MSSGNFFKFGKNHIHMDSMMNLVDEGQSQFDLANHIFVYKSRSWTIIMTIILKIIVGGNYVIISFCSGI